MRNFNKNKTFFLFRQVTVWSVAVCFISSALMPPPSALAQTLPQPGAMVSLSPAFVPPMITGITFYPDNPLKFDFLIGQGDERLEGEAFQEEAQKLINYFMAALTVPEDQVWVNLSPYEKGRIIAEGLSQTEMGRDMLAQDYLLKQLTASLMYPEEGVGKEFWDKIHKKVRERFGNVDVPIDIFHKVWIVPDEASVYVRGSTVFVSGSHLRVMLEEDYFASRNNSSQSHSVTKSQKQSGDSVTCDPVTLEVMRDVILPAIEKEINKGKNFANLRQIYHSMILATWYKRNLKASLLGQVYADRNKINGIDRVDQEVKEEIYNQYIAAFKKGVYDYIKEEQDAVTNEAIPRHYFSGGLEGLKDSALLSDSGPSHQLRQAAYAPHKKVTVDAAMVADTRLEENSHIVFRLRELKADLNKMHLLEHQAVEVDTLYGEGKTVLDYLDQFTLAHRPDFLNVKEIEEDEVLFPEMIYDAIMDLEASTRFYGYNRNNRQMQLLKDENGFLWGHFSISQKGLAGAHTWETLIKTAALFEQSPDQIGFLKDNTSRKHQGLVHNAGRGFALIGRLMEMTDVHLEYEISPTGPATTHLWFRIEPLLEVKAGKQGDLSDNAILTEGSPLSELTEEDWEGINLSLHALQGRAAAIQKAIEEARMTELFNELEAWVKEMTTALKQAESPEAAAKISSQILEKGRVWFKRFTAIKDAVDSQVKNVDSGAAEGMLFFNPDGSINENTDVEQVKYALNYDLVDKYSTFMALIAIKFHQLFFSKRIPNSDELLNRLSRLESPTDNYGRYIALIHDIADPVQVDETLDRTGYESKGFPHNIYTHFLVPYKLHLQARSKAQDQDSALLADIMKDPRARQLYGGKGVGLIRLRELAKKIGFKAPGFEILDTAFFDKWQQHKRNREAVYLEEHGEEIARAFVGAYRRAKTRGEKEDALRRLETGKLAFALTDLGIKSLKEMFIKRDPFSEGFKYDTRNKEEFIKSALRSEILERREKAGFSQASRSFILNKVKGLKEMIKVRSSGTQEDSFLKSLAGEHKSLTVREKKKVPGAVLEIYRDFRNTRTNSLFDKIAVILQDFVEADRGGVAFSSLLGMTTIEAVIGDPSKAVVGGNSTVIDMDGEDIGEITYGFLEHPRRVLLKGKLLKGYETEPVWKKRSHMVNTKNSGKKRSPLSESQIKEVARVARALAKELGYPVDIEYAFKQNQLYVLQVRSVTGKKGFAKPLPKFAEQDIIARVPAAINPVDHTGKLAVIEDLSPTQTRQRLRELQEEFGNDLILVTSLPQNVVSKEDQVSVMIDPYFANRIDHQAITLREEAETAYLGAPGLLPIVEEKIGLEIIGKSRKGHGNKTIDYVKLSREPVRIVSNGLRAIIVKADAKPIAKKGKTKVRFRKKGSGDQALLTSDQNGGIDFNPAQMDLRENGDAVQFELPELDPDNLPVIQGIRPVIINISPVNLAPMLLGEAENENTLAGV